MGQETLKIESQDVTIESIYKDFHSVPDFQREYVWERDQVEKLLQDIHDEFFDEEEQTAQNREYFLGSIVVCRAEDGIYSLIDGQQRMTTIYLVLCAIRDMLSELGVEPNTTLLNQIKDAFTNSKGEEEFRHRLVLQYDDSKGILKKLVNGDLDLDQITENTISVQRIRSAYYDIIDFLRTNYSSSIQKLRLFYAIFTQKVKLIRIITPSLTNALKVFETINDRGVGLNAMDLLKNLLFMKTSQSDYPILKKLWKDLIDVLDSCGEKPLRFLRYFIMSHYELDSNKPLREDEIYDWFTKNSKYIGLDNNPIEFLKILIQCSEAWSNCLQAKDINGGDNTFLNNLSILSGAARQHFILLLAGRHLSIEDFSTLCQSIENHFFCYIITREPTRTFERNFSMWSKKLREVENSKQLQDFIDEHIISDLSKRRKTFDFAFRELSQSRIQQYRMRYILAKFTQYIEQQAWNNPAHSSIDQYIASTVDIEHILPQTPEQEVFDNFDKKDRYFEYVEMLGNLTLLEKTINTSVSNDPFVMKLPGYRQSNYLLTRSIAEKPNVGSNTQLNRAVKKLIAFDAWTSISITKRQEMLVKLASYVWGMPEDESETGNE